MDGLKISEAARATGFTASALRFYEKERVVVPERTATGYRSYRDDHLNSLRLVARGKQLGLTLEDITELLELLDDEECAPVQSRLQHLVRERIGQTHQRIAELVAFTSQLQTAAARVGAHTPDGACDDDCGCRADPIDSAPVTSLALASPVGVTRREIDCSLPAGRVGDRISDWQQTLVSATDRTSIPSGIRVVFGRDVDVAAIARLAAEEQGCCPSFHFAIDIGPDEVTLTVTGPADLRPVIDETFGAAGGDRRGRSLAETSRGDQT